MGATGKYGWGGDRRSTQFLQVSELSKKKDENRLNDRLRNREKGVYEDILGKPSSSVRNELQRLVDAITVSENAYDSNDIMDSINPKYSESREYRINCSLCTTAFILKSRGYDVEAMARDSRWRGPLTVLNFDYNNFDNYVSPSSDVWYAGVSRAGYSLQFKNPNKFKASSKAVTNTIISTMQKWGNGSIAELSLAWKGSRSSHSLAVINNGGRVSIVDTQNGKIYSSESAILNLVKRSKPSSTLLQRFDNASLKDNVDSELSKMVKHK